MSMRGLVVREGRPTVVHDLPGPRLGEGEIEVRVVAASVNPTDLELAEGLYDAQLEARGKVHLPRTGLELSGIVTRGGRRFREGDAVFGYIDLLEGDKTHQERVAIREDGVASKPPELSFVEAAALPLGAETSLVALRDEVRASPGQRVLIQGASGGLGVYALQIAARLGLHITAVAGPGQAPFLHGLGAHRVLDYTQTDVRTLRETFDVVFDLTTRLQFAEIAHLLAPEGRFVPSEPLKAGVDFGGGAESGRRSVNLWVPRGEGKRLAEVAGWVRDGSLRVFVDSVFPFEEHAAAFGRLREHGKRGRVVMTLEEDA
ncbi:MAG: NAD(P)-dependent alcohol dehydrogenase [Myxococcota bacterium]